MSSINIPGLAHLQVGTIFCIGRNYAEHAREMNNDVPDEPLVFLKPASSVIFDGDSICIPSRSKNVHHEIELVAAIGKGGSHIREDEALQHVAGYGIGIDVTARDLQQQAKDRSQPWTVAKGFDTFAPISHFISAQELENPGDLVLKLSVNGAIRQHGNTKQMIFSVAALIAYLSSIFTLSPGDLIFTGTPEGVSPIQPGDNIAATLNKRLISLNISVQTDC